MNTHQHQIVGLIDESTPEAGSGIYYVMTTAVVLEEHLVTASLGTLFDGVGNRKRPFHWRKEGPEMRERMIDLIVDQVPIAHVRWQAVGRRKQIAARRTLLKALADDLAADGVDRLIIEQGDQHTNRRDLDTILDHYRSQDGPPFSYRWEGKRQRMLWIPDAISGAAGDHLLGRDTKHYHRLHDAGIVPETPESTV